MPITSQLRGSAFGDVPVQDWQAAKLLMPSAIKPVLATLDQTLLVKILGALSPRDTRSLREVITQIVG